MGCTTASKLVAELEFFFIQSRIIYSFIWLEKVTNAIMSMAYTASNKIR